MIVPEVGNFLQEVKRPAIFYQISRVVPTYDCVTQVRGYAGSALKHRIKDGTFEPGYDFTSTMNGIKIGSIYSSDGFAECNYLTDLEYEMLKLKHDDACTET